MQAKFVEEEVFEGDELEMRTEALVASERLRRNQEWMEEIFSSFGVDSIIAPNVVDTSPEAIQGAQKKKDLLEKEIELLKQNHEQTKAAFKKHIAGFRQATEQLTLLDDPAALEHHAKHLAESLGLHLVPATHSIEPRPIS